MLHGRVSVSCSLFTEPFASVVHRETSSFSRLEQVLLTRTNGCIEVDCLSASRSVTHRLPNAIVLEDGLRISWKEGISFRKRLQQLLYIGHLSLTFQGYCFRHDYESGWRTRMCPVNASCLLNVFSSAHREHRTLCRLALWVVSLSFQ